jgi:hypothetical protein
MESSPQPTHRPLLCRYFSSGWAFFMPYLFFYLLYYWRKWPVNPLPDHTLGSGGHIPALLHVYWALHVIHAILCLLALRAWCQDSQPRTLNSQPSTLRPLDSSLSTLASDLLPWFLLALIFYIPGTYLEWPSDPWQHYARINEWSGLSKVGDHSMWNKSSYFFAYSLLGSSPINRQFFLLGVYYTGICLLLCWQYYRLARAVGLGRRSAFVFVVLQTVLFGNDVFGFYRYYGIASTIFSQLGAIALIRLGLEVAQRQKLSASALFCLLSSAFCLALFIAFNHGQGLGIAALGLIAVGTWRLRRWKRAAPWAMLAAALLGSLAAVHWWPRNPALDQAYRPQGWLTSWYGFNIFSRQSPAGERALQILGLIGVANVFAGLILLHRNHVAGWLTTMPVLALSLPLVAIPMANAITAHAAGNLAIIFTFHRMFLAIPAGLALVCCGEHLVYRAAAARTSGALNFPFSTGLVALSLLVLTTLPASDPYYNRFWNALVNPPNDLSLKGIADGTVGRDVKNIGQGLSPKIIATPGIGYVIEATGINVTSYTDKWMSQSAPAAWLPASITVFSHARPAALLVIPSSKQLYTPASLAGILSGHWPPHEASFEYAGESELAAAAEKLGAQQVKLDGTTYYFFKKP